MTMSSPFDPAPPGSMRTTTADRERAVDVLKSAFAEGRLTMEEFEQRSSAALRSMTYGELQRLTADIPTGFVPRSPQIAPPPGRYPVPASVVYQPLPYRRTNGTSVASFVVSLVPIPLIGGVVAVGLGHAGLKQTSTGDEDGRGFAVAGLVLGYLQLAFIALLVVSGISH